DITRLSSFTQAVLKQTLRIPYGQVRTYKWLAARLGKPKAARAVGNALARNPLPIIIPCHRVVRGDGSIGRFALGSEWKKRLSELEKKFVKTEASSTNAG
ncbi:MAG: methylated-DNA--[protein]-cysteine S-methyltransferase, partial [Candidatus Binatia bacterium]